MYYLLVINQVVNHYVFTEKTYEETQCYITRKRDASHPYTEVFTYLFHNHFDKKDILTRYVRRKALRLYRTSRRKDAMLRVSTECFASQKRTYIIQSTNILI